ncbi:MAG: putative sulfate exporter family transporter [Nitrospira sp.]|nr:putative sulfate exporter family transporter [Nitrospira sp.]
MNENNDNSLTAGIFHLWQGLLLAIITGLAGYGISQYSNSNIADPLLIAMIIGIILKFIIGNNKKFITGISIAPAIFLPIGIFFYAANNLNFIKVTSIEVRIVPIVIAVMIVYVSVILLLGKLLGQKKEITYLTASGSAICGASAIAVTAPAIKASPDDTSVSLIAVAIAAFFGFAMILPFLGALYNFTPESYAMMSGSLLQFTGLVKAATQYIPYLSSASSLAETDTMALALSVKAFRYLGLLIVVPLFASLIEDRLSTPWILWAFLIAGLASTWIYASYPDFHKDTLLPFVKPIHNVSWSIAMAAIGLNTNIKVLLSNNGSKALIMAFGGFFAAASVFFAGIYLIK